MMAQLRTCFVRDLQLQEMLLYRLFKHIESGQGHASAAHLQHQHIQRPLQPCQQH